MINRKIEDLWFLWNLCNGMLNYYVSKEAWHSSVKRAINKEELEKISKEELVEVLYCVMYQLCADEDGKGDSGAISDYARALRLLARLGLFEIEREYGRMVVGKFKVEVV